ncbi:MAG: hypothetical protein IJU76_03295 [Desulfovibrionaceae bacterium]|nr:hypothetical protein [Desulfovibrionaceae bacterium]
MIQEKQGGPNGLGFIRGDLLSERLSASQYGSFQGMRSNCYAQEYLPLIFCACSMNASVLTGEVVAFNRQNKLTHPLSFLPRAALRYAPLPVRFSALIGK